MKLNEIQTQIMHMYIYWNGDDIHNGGLPPQVKLYAICKSKCDHDISWYIYTWFSFAQEPPCWWLPWAKLAWLAAIFLDQFRSKENFWWFIRHSLGSVIDTSYLHTCPFIYFDYLISFYNYLQSQTGEVITYLALLMTTPAAPLRGEKIFKTVRGVIKKKKREKSGQADRLGWPPSPEAVRKM